MLLGVAFRDQSRMCQKDLVTCQSMGRQHVHAGILFVTAQKTGQDVHIPLHSELKSVIESRPRDNVTVLMTSQGHPPTPNRIHQLVS